MDCGEITQNLITTPGVLDKRGRLSPKAGPLIDSHPLIEAIRGCLPWAKTHAEMIACIKQGITQQPLCECGTPLPFKNSSYTKSCGRKCGARIAQVQRDKTNLERYGARCPSNTDEGQTKRQATWIARLGVDHPSKSAAVIEKRNASYTSEQRRQTAATYNSRTGVWPSQISIAPASLDILRDSEELHKLHVEDGMSAVAIAERLGVGATTVLRWLQRHDIPLTHTNVSSYEHSIRALLQDWGIDYVPNCRSVLGGREIDIWVPSQRLGIEVCGTYWHHDGIRSRTYHLEKLLAAQKAQARLIQIFEWELLSKWDVVVERLAAKLGVIEPSILHARHLSIGPVSSAESQAFMDAHHIQGHVAASVHIGATAPDGTLRAVMTFGKPRYSSAHQWELLRYATLGGCGVANRLFKHFVATHSPQTIVTYSDRRWNDGGVYQSLGMTYQGDTRPSYYYVHANTTNRAYHRSSFMKHTLAQRLTHYDSNLTEAANMAANGYMRIWDCGHQRFTWSAS